MNLVVEKNEFLRKLLRTQYVHEKKTTLDITNCVLLRTHDKELEIIATDLETNFRDYCSAKIKDKGTIAVNSKKLMEVIRGLTTDEISIRMIPGENTLVVEGGRSIFRLPTRAPEDFPPTPFFDDHELTQLDASIFKKMVDKVLFSVPTRRTRSNITGLIIKEGDQSEAEGSNNGKNSIEMFSVDVHRMVRIEQEFDGLETANLSSGIVLPKRSAQELSNVLQDSDVFNLGALENFLVVRKASCSLTIRLLNFEIPRIDVKMLTNTPYNLQARRETLIEVFKRIAIMTSEDYRHVLVNLTESQISFSVNNPGVGTAEEDLEVNYSGPNMNFAFNIRYLIEALSNMESETINIGVIREKAPFIFTGNEDEGYISVLMPLILISEDEEEIASE